MRILHIVDHSIPLQSGYTFRSSAIFRQQKALGWDTFHLTGPKHALVSPDNPPRELVDELLFYRTQPERGFSARLPVVNQLAVIRALKRRLREVVRLAEPDILHAHSPALNGVATMIVGKQLNIPCVYEVRGFWEDAAVSHGTSREGGLRYRLTRGMETWVLRRADAVTCICQGIKGDLVERGIPEQRITIIPNAVDPDRFRASPRRDLELDSELGLSGKPVLGFVGSFYAYEGLSLLLDAMPLILERNPDTCVLLVGGGQQADNLRAQAKSISIEDRVIFTGRVPHDQVARYYSLIDILCYPRVPMRVTELITPLKPLEAMAQQKPVIASNVGGHRELIRDGKTGTLFKAGDAGDLASKVISLFDNRQDWPQMLTAARQFVERERSWARSIAGYGPVYERLCLDR